MKYENIKYVNKKISKIVFGCANPNLIQGKKIYKLLDAVLEMGINTFDTAESYGASEDILGKWLKKRKNRDRVVLITKGCHPHGVSRVTPEALKEDIEKSFKRLKIDYIDIYMLHRDHPDADVKAIMEKLNEYHKKGMIGAFGASNWTHMRIAEANKYALEHDLIPLTVSSPNFGPAKQVADPWGGGCISISGSGNEEARKWYQENQIPVFAYSCLGRGMFSGKVKTSDLDHSKENMDKFAIRGYWCQENINRLSRIEEIAQKKGCSVAQVSLAWIMQQEFLAFPIVTISDEKRIAENVGALEVRLNKEEMKMITGV